MSTQSTLKDFFKPKFKPTNMSTRKKKPTLSLNKTSPTKIPKLNQDKSIPVINLDSDEENYLNEPFSDTEKFRRISISSESTIIYSPETPKKGMLQTSKQNTPTKHACTPCVPIHTQSSHTSESTPKQTQEMLRNTVIVTPSNLVTTQSESKLPKIGKDKIGKDISSTLNIATHQIKMDLTKPEPVPSPKSNFDLAETNIDTPQSTKCMLNMGNTPMKPAPKVTPKKIPKTPQSHMSTGSENSLSPQSKNGTPKKFYSPTKKRAEIIRRPNKVRKNLSNSLNAESPSYGDSVQKQTAYHDKTNFTIDIIMKYLYEPSLTPLLDEKSFNLLNAFVLQNKSSVKLVCNLYGRKDRWFRWDEIKSIVAKKNIKCDDVSCHQILTSLLQCDIIDASNYQGHKQSLNFDECVAVLKKNELSAVCKQYNLKPTSKSNCIDLLKGFSRRKSNISLYLTGVSTSNNEKRVLHSLTEKLGACFKLSEVMRRTLDELYILMYLGIDYDIIKEKKLELTLINDKANIQTFPYKNAKTDNASVVFKSREEFQRFLSALSVHDEYHSISGLNQHCDCVRRVYQMYQDISEDAMKRYTEMPVWLHRFTPPNVFIKILDDGIKFLKQDKSPESIGLALDILSMLISQTTFRQHKKLMWYSEKALILDKIESKSDEAALVLLDGLNLDHGDDAKDVLRKRATLLAKRKTNSISPELQAELLKYAEIEDRLEKQFESKHIYKAPKENSRGGKIKFETRLNGEILVQDAEDFCLSHYLQSGQYTHGGHWEGRIITTIFFLLLWEEIYNQEYLIPQVPGLVLCQYQQYPLDLYGEGFYRNRRKILEHRLAEIQRLSVREILMQMKIVWDARPEYELSGINRSIPYEVVSGTAECVGPAGLAAICRRLAMRYGHAHSGFPDLTVFNCNTKQIMFVEVKTDSDRPSMRQLQWMQFLRDHSLPVQFCYVGTETTKCKARS